MFNIECIIYLLIIIYSIFYQFKVIILYNKNKKVVLNDASGLFVAKDILNKNGLGTLYVTKINGKYNDHYDIERNVIRLSEEVYQESNLASMVIGIYQSINALCFNDRKKSKEMKMKNTIIDYSNKISFILFILGISSKALDVMTLCLLIMIINIVAKYIIMNKKIEKFNENIKYIKKEYKIKQDNLNKIENNIKALFYNELSLHILNNKY